MFEQNVPLSKYSNFKIGGSAAYFFHAKNAEQVITAATKARELGLDIFVLGAATNLLISDEGYNGLVLKLDVTGVSRGGNQIKVGAGALVADVLNFTVQESLSGLEWAGGLPGTIGGAIFGNAGAFGGEIKDNLVSVTSIDLNQENLEIKERNNKECSFDYRSSIFKTGRQDGTNEVILEAVFQMEEGEKEEIKKSIQEKIDYRASRQPLEYPNIGSIFKNVPIERVPEETKAKFEHKIKTDPFPVLPNAVLADAAGLKTRRVGGAEVSEKHPNFIVNRGNATAEDVKKLIEEVKKEIKDNFDVDIEQEVIDL